MKTTLFIAALAACSSLTFASSPELREAGRKLSQSHHDSVVWLSVLSKMNVDAEGDVAPEVKSMLAAQGSESKSEVTGTVVDESGLIVTSLAGLDKASLLNGRTVSTQMGQIKLKTSAEIKEVKVITSDGSEVPADLVLKDEDLGLAFVRIRTGTEEAKNLKITALNLADSATAEVLDECVTLGRLDESLDRSPCMLSGEIIGKAVKPRVIYRVKDDTVGCPVFLSSGKLLGISVIPKVRKMTDAGGETQLSCVVLPAADILKVADQAKKAAVPAK